MVYLELFHGRRSQGENLDDWGFEGPVLGPFPFVHITYGSDIKTGEWWQGKKPLCSLEIINSLSIGKEGLVEFAGAYYGDISTFSSPSKEVKRRIRETLKVFQTDPVLLVGDNRDWVKIFCEWRLKNDSNTPKHGTNG